MGGDVVGGGVPTGTVSFWFTDVEGSTQLWDRAADRMAEALELHDRLVRSVVATEGGLVFTTAGDSFSVAFQSAAAAVAAAVGVQRALGEADWPDGAEIRVRIGMHSGEAQQRDGDYFGVDVIRAARIMSAAHGGQILISTATATLVDGVSTAPVGELELRGLGGTELVHQVLAEGLEDRFPSLRGVVGRTNLPVERDRLVGRREELAEVVELLSAQRAVTLVGPGGVGKTRLGVEASSRVAARYGDGVWFVDLAGVSTVEEMAPAIGSVLGLQSAAASSLEAVAVAVGQLDVLVVLDNCEHVIEGAARFVDGLLGQSAGSVLSTSRERLDVRGEFPVRLPPLGVDGEDADGVRLFLERAEQAGHRVDLTDDSPRSAVERICSALDGSPLAIELAASRLASMGLEELERRLDDRFRVLRRRGRTRHRHETLLHTLRWSYELLGEVERDVFDRISLMSGEFEVGEVLGLFPDLDELDLVDALDALVEASLVEPAIDSGMRLSESTRAFGRQNLRDSGRDAEVAQLHTDAVVGDVELIGAGLRSADELAWWTVLQRRIPDIRSVIQRSVDGGDPAPGCRIITELVELTFNAALPEVTVWAGDVASLPNVEEEDDYPAVISAAGYGALSRADRAALDRWGGRLGQAPIGSSLSVRGAAQNLLAAVRILSGDHAAASEIYRAVGEQADEEGDQGIAAFYYGSAAFQLSFAGRNAEALPVAERSLRRAESCGQPSTISWCHAVLAFASVADPERHEAHLLRCLETSERGVPSRIQDSVSARLAELRSRERGDPAALHRLCQQALENPLRANAFVWFWPNLARVASVLAAQGLFEPAGQLLGAWEASIYPADAPLRGLRDKVRGRLEAGMDQADLHTEIERGRGLTPRVAVDLALEALWSRVLEQDATASAQPE